ncbi:MAG: pyridoxal kinase PdxY [Alphaproteobacteria bacterium]|nr:pyridoxal kinase PdxY [Alphaproteobacteria bacterium]
MNILSIQSSVVYGHVGNSAAAFALQALGHEVWPLNTVEFSNHPGRGARTGRINDSGHLRDLLDGLDRLGVLGDCNAILSGYLGSAQNGAVALEAVARVRAARSNAVYCCDPVMGNEKKGLFVTPDVAEFIRNRAAAEADILVPNRFELGHLTGRDIGGVADACAAAMSLAEQGPEIVVVKGIRSDDRVAALACTGGQTWLVETPRLDDVADDGAGDLFTAILLGRLLGGAKPAAALEQAASSTFAVLEETRTVGADELALIANRTAVTDPQRRFEAEALS